MQFNFAHIVLIQVPHIGPLLNSEELNKIRSEAYRDILILIHFMIK
jgi:hypothetical protein